MLEQHLDKFIDLGEPLLQDFDDLLRVVAELFELVDPEILIARYEGACLSTEGVRYDNSYLAIFEFAEGRIRRWCEYDDPTVSAASMAAHAAAMQARRDAGA